MATNIYFKKTFTTGFTLVEVLVGMVISLAAILAIFQSYSAFEGRKRTIESNNSAQLDSAFISTTLDREIRKAGYGFAQSSALGCATNFYNDDLPTKEYVQRLIPALIIDGGGGASDKLQIMSGNNQALTALILTANSKSNLDNSGTVTRKMKVKNTFGIRVGDFFILTNVPGGVSFSEPNADKCTFGQATTSTGPGLVTATNSVFNNSEIDRAYGNGPCNSGDADCNNGSKYNFPASATYTPVEYKQQTSGLIPLGSLFTQTYSVANTGQDYVLRQQSATSGAVSGSPTDIATGVVNLQAQYGVDTNGDDVIDYWVEPTVNWASSRLNNTTQDATEIKDIWKIKALRIAIITRSNLLEKAGSCPAVPPTGITVSWPTGPNMTATVPANPAGNCYRYQASKINVVLKNVLWSVAGDL